MVKKTILLLVLFLASCSCGRETVIFTQNFTIKELPKKIPIDNYSPQQKFSMFVYNAKLLPIIASDNKLKRAMQIPQAIDIYPDVIILCEAYDLEATNILLAGLHHKGYCYTAGTKDNSVFSFGSGIRIASRWPIDLERSLTFDYSVLPDSFANKGIAYVRIDKLGHYYHVFGMHLQSTILFRSCSKQVQTDQWIQLERFIRQQKIPIREPVLIGGDLNYNLYDKRDRQILLNLIPVALPLIDKKNGKYTYHGVNNSLTASSSLRWIDYCLYHLNYLPPLWARLSVYIPKNNKGQDLSDHYAVVGEFLFPKE